MIDIIFRAILIAMCGVLWRLSGKGGFPHAKFFRRFINPLLIIIPSLLSGKIILSIIAYPLFVGAFCLPYDKGYGIRALCGFCYSFAALPILIDKIALFAFSMVVVTIGVMLAGNQVFKLTDDKEEFFIGIITSAFPIIGG